MLSYVVVAVVALPMVGLLLAMLARLEEVVATDTRPAPSEPA